MIALVRPDAWNFPLLLHVGGAMLLVASLVTAGATLVLAMRPGDAPMATPTLTRMGFRTLLLAAIPSYIVMRGGAQWIASKEGLEDSDVSWIGIGFITSDAGLLILIAGTIVAGLATRRFKRPEANRSPSRAAPIIVFVLVAVYLFAIWAMTTKPT